MKKHTKVNFFDMQLGMATEEQNVYKPSLPILFGWGVRWRGKRRLRAAGPTPVTPQGHRTKRPVCAGTTGVSRPLRPEAGTGGSWEAGAGRAEGLAVSLLFILMCQALLFRGPWLLPVLVTILNLLGHFQGKSLLGLT